MERVCKKIRKVQIFSGTTLKIVATIAMSIEHFSKIVLAYITGAVWFPMQLNGLLAHDKYIQIDEFIRFTLYKVGDIAYPLLFLLISEGYRYTKDRKKYITRMLIFALISEIPFDVGFFSILSTREGTFPFYWKYQNVLFTYFFSLVCLYGIDKIKEHLSENRNGKRPLFIFFAALCLVATISITELLHCDYGATGVLLIIFFYLFRDRRFFQASALLFVHMIASGSQPNIFVVIAAVMICLYSGKKGKDINKYFFYLFYPIHIMILYLVTLVLGVFI